MRDLTKFQKDIWEAPTLDRKRRIAMEMVDGSHAKKETKFRHRRAILGMKSATRLDQWAANYAFAGEGMKV
jgi:hypothetical protein